MPIQPPPLCYGNSNECPVHITLVILESSKLYVRQLFTTWTICLRRQPDSTSSEVEGVRIVGISFRNITKNKK